MSQLTRRMFEGTSLYPKIKSLGHYPDYLWWILRGKPVRSPHLLKQKTVLEYGRRFGLRNFVETGTYHGEMVQAALRHFDRIYSVELDPKLAAFARARFERQTHVRILEGSSEVRIPEVLAELDSAALFWMDAGYYGSGAQLGNIDRLRSELNCILSHAQQHIVLMDDARVFTGGDGKTSAAQLISEIEQRFPNRKVEIVRDIFRISFR